MGDAKSSGATYCTQCGKKLAGKNARFCAKCGAPVAPEESADLDTGTRPLSTTPATATPARLVESAGAEDQFHSQHPAQSNTPIESPHSAGGGFSTPIPPRPGAPAPQGFDDSSEADDETSANKPPNNKVWAYVSLFAFCIPLGAVAITYANKVDFLWSTGEFKKAWSSSNKALTWSLIGIGLGILGYAALAIGLIAGGLSQVSGSAYTCNDLASESVRISEDQNKGTTNPVLLRVEMPRVVSDMQSTSKPPSSGELVVLKCTGRGYFSNTENATVNLTLSLDSDGNQWVAYVAQ